MNRSTIIVVIGANLKLGLRKRSRMIVQSAAVR
jgi:hypothetical protein